MNLMRILFISNFNMFSCEVITKTLNMANTYAI